MRTAATSFLIGSLACAGLVLGPAGVSLRAQGDKPHRASVALSASFIATDDRQNCASKARQQFTVSGWDGDPRAGYTDHYNQRMKTCFVQIDKSGVTAQGWTYVYKTVGDAEGREYADYMWGADNAKASADVPPSICEVILSSGEEMECRSAREFDELVKNYME
jgi:hypothetical protein